MNDAMVLVDIRRTGREDQVGLCNAAVKGQPFHRGSFVALLRIP